MSLQFLHDEIRKALEDEAARLAQQAISMRASVGLPADEYAMVQCQTLATAYGLTQAMQIVAREYRRMVDPHKDAEGTDESHKPQQRPLYG